MLEKPVSRANYTPLLKAIVNNKAAILSTSDNIPDVIQSFTEETRTSPTILGALLDEAIKCDELMIRFSPVFAFLDKNGLVQVALHATSLLPDISNMTVKKEALEAILASMGLVLVENIGEPSIWEFFFNGIKLQSKEFLIHNGMKKLVACAVIDSINDYFVSNQSESSVEKELLKTLIELSNFGKFHTIL